MEMSDLTVGVSVFAGHTVGFQSEYSPEGKLIAGTVITAADPHLFGLVITNFGCEPNSFILRI